MSIGRDWRQRDKTGHHAVSDVMCQSNWSQQKVWLKIFQRLSRDFFEKDFSNIILRLNIDFSKINIIWRLNRGFHRYFKYFQKFSNIFHIFLSQILKIVPSCYSYLLCILNFVLYCQPQAKATTKSMPGRLYIYTK